VGRARSLRVMAPNMSRVGRRVFAALPDSFRGRGAHIVAAACSSAGVRAPWQDHSRNGCQSRSDQLPSHFTNGASQILAQAPRRTWSQHAGGRCARVLQGVATSVQLARPSARRARARRVGTLARIRPICHQYLAFPPVWWSQRVSASGHSKAPGEKQGEKRRPKARPERAHAGALVHTALRGTGRRACSRAPPPDATPRPCVQCCDFKLHTATEFHIFFGGLLLPRSSCHLQC